MLKVFRSNRKKLQLSILRLILRLQAHLHSVRWYHIIWEKEQNLFPRFFLFCYTLYK